MKSLLTKLSSSLLMSCLMAPVLTTATQAQTVAEKTITKKSVKKSLVQKKDAKLNPIQITSKLKTAFSIVKDSCVSITVNGTGSSGTIISKDGLILTAGHVVRRTYKKPPNISILLCDGRNLKAEIIGCNLNEDIGLIKITSKINKPLTVAKLALTADAPGNFCLMFGHPAGRKSYRPAQLRLGRITKHLKVKNSDTTRIVYADANMQPGDSGAGLFNMEGQLIGVASSASRNVINYNRYPSVEMFHKHKDRILRKEKWGDLKNGPGGNPLDLGVKLSMPQYKLLQKELFTLLKANHTPTQRLIEWQQRKTPNKPVNITTGQLFRHFINHVVEKLYNRPYSLGLNAPLILKQIPKKTSATPAPVKLYANKLEYAQALPVTSNLALVKLSMLKNKDQKGKKFSLRLGSKHWPVSIVAENKQWDLALVKHGYTRLKTPKFAISQTNIKAGDGLLAYDWKNSPIWGIAADTERPAPHNISVGLVPKKEDFLYANRHRAPYPNVIRHTVPLYATDVMTPVYDLHQNLVGIHICRHCRVTGYIMPAKEFQKTLSEMIKQAKAKKVNAK